MGRRLPKRAQPGWPPPRADTEAGPGPGDRLEVWIPWRRVATGLAFRARERFRRRLARAGGRTCMLRPRMAQRASLVALIALLLVVEATVASADPISESQGFRKAVAVAGIREHQLALQRIADANGGTRAVGTPGYDASVEYIV